MLHSQDKSPQIRDSIINNKQGFTQKTSPTSWDEAQCNLVYLRKTGVFHGIIKLLKTSEDLSWREINSTAGRHKKMNSFSCWKAFLKMEISVRKRYDWPTNPYYSDACLLHTLSPSQLAASFWLFSQSKYKDAWNSYWISTSDGVTYLWD